MKKSLLALAVLGAFAGAASAQSSVTVYGVVDAAIQYQNNGNPAGSKWALDSGMQNGSRLGFKGTEDLGGGLKANFKLETGINIDTGGSSQGGLVFGRQTWVGLSGDFGSVTAGRQYSPIFLAADSIDPFDAGIISGAAGAGTSTDGTVLFFGNFSNRTNNTVNYTTNNLGGFTGSVAYSFGEVAGDNSANRRIGLSGTYANGPVLVTAAYDKANDALGNATKNAFIGGTYDFKVVKAALAYGKNTTDAGVAAQVDTKTWMLGVTVPVGAGNILGSYTRQTNNLPVPATAGGKGDQIAVGYTYNLSKRTNLYTSYARTANDAGTNAGGLAFANGLTDKQFNVGIDHRF